MTRIDFLLELGTPTSSWSWTLVEASRVEALIELQDESRVDRDNRAKIDGASRRCFREHWAEGVRTSAAKW